MNFKQRSKKQIIEKIKQLLADNNLTQIALAQLANKSERRVSDILTGNNPAAPEACEELLNALGYQIDPLTFSTLQEDDRVQTKGEQYKIRNGTGAIYTVLYFQREDGNRYNLLEWAEYNYTGKVYVVHKEKWKHLVSRTIKISS